MKPAPLALLTLALLFGLSGCYRQSIRAVDEQGERLTDRGGERDSEATYGFWYGAIAGKIEVECPNGIARLDTGLVWYSYLVMYVSAGIVVPMRATYTCNEAPQPAEELPNGGW